MSRALPGTTRVGSCGPCSPPSPRPAPRTLPRLAWNASRVPLPLAANPRPSNPSRGRRVVSNEERGPGETRTPDPRTASAMRYQLRHKPKRTERVSQAGLVFASTAPGGLRGLLVRALLYPVTGVSTLSERGDGENRTPDTRDANAVLYQLSYDPRCGKWMRPCFPPDKAPFSPTAFASTRATVAKPTSITREAEGRTSRRWDLHRWTRGDSNP